MNQKPTTIIGPALAERYGLRDGADLDALDAKLWEAQDGEPEVFAELRTTLKERLDACIRKYVPNAKKR
jgi:hypothetical protein